MSMDARIKCVAFTALCLLSLGANHRTTNFVITAPTKEFAVKTGDLAEHYRKTLAIEWLGKELPRWQKPCPISVQVGNMGAGGVTSFAFTNRGVPINWTMSIQGPPDRVLDAVLPHEITHTIFATHFGRPLPRWADEGACTTVEHISERKKQERMLINFLTHNRGIAFNRMFAMKEYPRDVMPLYSQGYSLARYLIAQGGRRKFVEYVGDGMNWNNWTAATKKHYGIDSLSNLQLTWLDWVRQGSPDTADPTLIASTPAAALPVSPERDNDLVPVDPVSIQSATPPLDSLASEESDGWYARQADLAQTTPITNVTRPQPLGRPRQRVIQGAPAPPITLHGPGRQGPAFQSPGIRTAQPPARIYYDPGTARRY